MNLPNVVYINGLDLMTGSHGLSQDGVHPNARGCEEIAENLTRIIKANFKEQSCTSGVGKILL